MKVTPLQITGALLLESVPYRDERGAFEVFWEAGKEFSGLPSMSPWGSYHSFNDKAHTLRGMHYQADPHAQARLVSCVRGSVWDVTVDLRPRSPTYLRWEAIELGEERGRAVYVPRGCAHGFLTLEDRSTVAYLIEGAYAPDSAATLRWNDPAVGIDWPLPAGSRPIVSSRDGSAPDYRR